MLNIFIGFVTFYLSFLLLIMLFNFALSIIAPEWSVTYQKTLQIVNVSFAVSLLIFILATLFIIPLDKSDEVKQNLLMFTFALIYFSTAAFAYYDQHKNRNNKNDIEENVDDSSDEE